MPNRKLHQLDEFYLEIQNDGSGVYVRSDAIFAIKNDRRVYRNPYPGLRPFKTSEYIFFSGRREQTTSLLDLLKNGNFIAVIGSSGTGKSSLVRAGLMPELYKDDHLKTNAKWDVAICRPGGDPIGNLAAALSMTKTYREQDGSLVPKRPKIDDIQKGISEVEQLLYDSPYGITEFYNTLNGDDKKDPTETSAYNVSGGRRLLIVIDQFEELFRFDTDSVSQVENDVVLSKDEAKEHFVNLLLEATSGEIHDDSKKASPIFIIITMRSEFLGDCVRYRNLPEAINSGQYLVPCLTSDQLRMAIQDPLKIVEKSISEDLLERLISETEFLSSIGNLDQLPLLQHTMMRIFDRSTSEILKDEDFVAGTMQKELSNHAQEVYDSLAAEDQFIAKTIFQTLTESITGPKGGRRPTRLSIIQDIASANLRRRLKQSEDFLKSPVQKDISRYKTIKRESFEIKREIIKVRWRVTSVIDRFRSEENSFLMPPAKFKIHKTTIVDISHESLMRNWELLEKEWVKAEKKFGEFYKMLHDRRALAALSPDDDWISGFHLAEMKKWNDSHRNCLEWSYRYHSLTTKGTQHPTTDDQTSYEQNCLFLVNSISAESVEKKKRLLTRILKVAMFLIPVLCGILWVTIIEKRKLAIQMSNSDWLAFLDSVEIEAFRNDAIYNNPFRAKPDNDAVLSYKWLAEAKAQLDLDPDLAFQLARSAVAYENQRAEEWILSEIENKYGYKRKTVVKGIVLGIEYSPHGDSLNVLTRNRTLGIGDNARTSNIYYSVSNKEKGFRTAETIEVSKDDLPHIQYFGPDGKYLLRLDRKRQLICSIGKYDRTEECRSIQNFDNIDIVEICPQGKFLLVIKKTDSVSTVFLHDFENEKLLTLQKPIKTLKHRAVYAYFFDGSAGLAIVGTNTVDILNTKTKEWNTITMGSREQIFSSAVNDQTKQHVFNCENIIYLVKYNDSFKIKSLNDNTSRIINIPMGVANNATITSSGRYLAYINKIDESTTNLNIQVLDSARNGSTIISWPGFAPQYIKNNSSSTNNLILTAGSPEIIRPYDDMTWYVYEWDLDQLATLTYEDIFVDGFLRNLSLQDSIQSGLLNINLQESNMQKILAFGNFYSDPGNGRRSRVFSLLPATTVKDNNASINFMAKSTPFYDRYFSNSAIVDDSFSKFAKVSADLDNARAKQTKQPLNSNFSNFIEKAANLRAKLRNGNDLQSQLEFDRGIITYLMNGRTLVLEEQRTLADLQINPGLQNVAAN